MTGVETPPSGRETPPSTPPRRGSAAAAALLVAGVVSLFGASASLQYSPLSYLPGDCPYYAATAVSLLQDRDLDLRNQLRGGLEVHGRQIALGRDGAWYPKHPILMPLLALPFLAGFGMPGLLVFNLAVLASLSVALMLLARPFASPWPSAAAAFLLIGGTFLRRYDYNFSPDLFATLILTLGLASLVAGRDRLAGLLAGLAVLARLSHVLLAPAGLLFAALCRGRRGALRFGAGAAGPLLALALLNQALFGSPLTTSYDRNVVASGGAIVTVSHRGFFDAPPLRGLAAELFDPQHGLLPTSPVLLLAIPGFVLLFRRRPREAVLFLAVAEFLLLFFATYRYWSASHYGNRFLMPVVAVAAPPVALTLELLAARLVAVLGRRHGDRATAGAPA